MKLKKNYKVIISDSAKADMKEAALWYHQKQKELGKRFTQSIRKCVKIIKFQLECFQIRYKNNRLAIPDKFPYLIIYNINKDKKTIRVIAIIHSSQNPEKWNNMA